MGGDQRHQRTDIPAQPHGYGRDPICQLPCKWDHHATFSFFQPLLKVMPRFAVDWCNRAAAVPMPAGGPNDCRGLLPAIAKSDPVRRNQPFTGWDKMRASTGSGQFQRPKIGGPMLLPQNMVFAGEFRRDVASKGQKMTPPWTYRTTRLDLSVGFRNVYGQLEGPW
jgi:hypothetical protein